MSFFSNTYIGEFILCFSYRYEGNKNNKNSIIECTTQFNLENLFLNICGLVYKS